jgi:hypothetical protein
VIFSHYETVKHVLNVSSAEEAIKVMKDTQEALKKYGNPRLHKFVSNSFEVMSAFPSSA